MLTARLAETKEDLQAAQALRYTVFVKEFGSSGAGVDHEAGLEVDRFDRFADHLLLEDPSRPIPNRCVGVYRILTSDMAKRAGGFYSAGEYDLTVLTGSGRPLMELGRSCLHPDYRQGVGMHTLWTALADYVDRNGIEILFGVASFPGQDVKALAEPLALLHHGHLAPAELRVRARGETAHAMDLVPPDQIDRRAAMQKMPQLIKAYLRLGGMVGQGAWVDRTFNTTDVCLVLDRYRMNARQLALYRGQWT